MKKFAIFYTQSHFTPNIDSSSFEFAETILLSIYSDIFLVVLHIFIVNNIKYTTQVFQW